MVQKKRLPLLIVLLCVHAVTLSAQYDSLFFENRWRTYLVHLPPQYEAAEDTLFPLILALHGGFGSAYNLQNQSKLSQKADTTAIPFIVVYPEGFKNPIGFRSWNAGACCGYAQDNDINDVGFISVLIDTLLNRYSIDESRVYATGMSNGGMMCYRLVAEMERKIAAIAPVSSTSVLEGPWSPAAPMPIIHFHSYLDENVPFYGGEGNGFSDVPYPPVDSVLNVWSGQNGCVDENDTLYNEEGDYLFKVWTQCDNDADIHLYVTYDGGHSWPGGERGTPWGDPPSEKINANDLMWSFFREHPAGGVSITLDTGTLPHHNSLYQNYPNPFNPRTVIGFHLDEAGEVELSIYTALGRKVCTLVSGVKRPGRYEIIWDGTDKRGVELASGVYFYRLRTGDFFESRKMVLIR